MQLELSSQEWAALMSAVAEHENQLAYFMEKYSECALELKVIRNVKDKLIILTCEATMQTELFM